MLKSLHKPLHRIRYNTLLTTHTLKMTLKTLTASSAASLDADLMSEATGFSIDQLMELAGLSVAQAIYTVHPPSSGRNILLACGPGNNGGDGLVAARHLYHFGYTPKVYYPKPTKKPIFEGLQKQLRALEVEFVDDFEKGLADGEVGLVVDALFGFSFKPPVREPFVKVIERLARCEVPVLSVDVPSCWDVDQGPPKEGELGSAFMPEYLVSLTAPKPCVEWFRGKRHFVGGRFLGKGVAEKYGLEVPKYSGMEQIAELEVGAKVEKL